jgi:5-methylcytosine-specific restriction endonuclease McrA
MHEPVLVLNANFAPINVCATRRAIGLIITDKANLVLNGRGLIKTISRDFRRPSIIRLQRMIKRPHPRVKLNKREVFRRDKFTCQYCGGNNPPLTLDHVVPKHLGGLHTWNNLVTACAACNHRKGGRITRQARMVLRKIPIEPPASAEYLFARHTKGNIDWIPFLEGW